MTMTPAGETTAEHVYEALGHVIDPELGLDIVTLGLVYDVAVHERAIDVTFTLTTRGCPMERIIHRGILQVLDGLPGIDEVHPHLVWEPRWHPGLMKREVP